VGGCAPNTSSFIWSELYPPRNIDLAAVTALVRPLVNRPQLGLIPRTPAVVFELWSHQGTLRWLLGVERVLGVRFADQLSAQVPRLQMIRLKDAGRPIALLASNIRLTGLSQLLRLDMATAVSTGLFGALRTLGVNEAAVVQWVVGPGRPRRVFPTPQTWLQRLGLASPLEPTSLDLRYWRSKVVEPLFAVRGRIGASATTAQRASAITRMLSHALTLANASHAEVRITGPTARIAKRLHRVTYQLERWGGTANAAELGMLLGFPVDGSGIGTLPS
jgi:hypothetical protein